MAAELPEEVRKALAAIDHALGVYSVEMSERSVASADTWLEALAATGEAVRSIRLGQRIISEHFGMPSATDRILNFLLLHVGEVVYQDQLIGVSGIQEYRRRISELRVERGWPIESLPGGSYRLLADQPDEAEARRWAIAKKIRNQGGSGGQRALDLLKAIHPEAADKDQLAYVAQISSYPRRLREFIEQGWQIATSESDASLPTGSYRLDSRVRLPPRAREHIKLRMEILDRDRHACRVCGRSPAKGDDVILQIHHIVLVVSGGTNDQVNLVTLCKECHAGRHAVDGRPNRRVVDELLQPEGEPDYITPGTETWES